MKVERISQKGFTLIELVVVMAIIGILVPLHLLGQVMYSAWEKKALAKSKLLFSIETIPSRE